MNNETVSNESNEMEILDIVKVAYKALDDKLAMNIKVLDIQEISVLADYFIIAHGNNINQIDAMINDGDTVIMKRAHDAHNGEMVAVWRTDKNETTLKRFYKEKDHVRLQPENPAMEAIIVDDPSPLQIHGKVVMVFRQVSGPAS